MARKSASGRSKRGARLNAVSVGIAVAFIASSAVLGLLVFRSRATREPLKLAHLAEGSGTGDVPRDLQLATFLSSLTGAQKQELTGALARYDIAPIVEMPPPRQVIGSATAPVRITYWIDVLGAGSASLHQSARETHLLLGGDKVALEPRQFPRDGACNPKIDDRHDPSVRCLAARLLICLEGAPTYLEVATRLIGDPHITKAPGAVASGLSQRTLSPRRVMQDAAAGGDAVALDRCAQDPATEAKLADDVALASRLGNDSKPYVVVNGRRATTSGALLRVLALTGGRSRHPAFRELPLSE